MLSIVAMAQKYLAAQGVDQWQDGYPNERVMAGDIHDGAAYVLERRGQVIGIATVLFTGEPTYAVIEDGAWASPEPYACIHRIALAATARGSGASGELMAGAERLIRERGVWGVRVDTHRDNRVMRGMLQKNGYAACGVIYLADGQPRVAFEKTLG